MNDLSVYERIADPIKAIDTLGEVIARSRIFGCESLEQGKVLAWECLARRTPPLQLKETYHLINTSQGTALTMRADAMLAGFLSLGGRHRILQRDGERAAVELTYAGQSAVFECTYADAKDAGLTEGKKGEKENWSSPRQRMQMLWARAVSDGVRAMAPQVCAGKYAPEDFGRNLNADSDPQIVEGEVVENRVSPAAVEPAGKEPAGTDAAGMAAGQAASDSTADGTGECSADQRSRIVAYFEQLGLTAEQRDAVLRKRGVGALRSLTSNQADELLTALERKAAQIPAGASRQPEDANQARVDGPASQAQIDELKKTLLPALAQSHPELYAKLTGKIRAFGKLADLTFEQARSLIQQVKTKNLEAFFAASLEKPVVTASAATDP